MDLSESLLISTLAALRESVERMRIKQDSMQSDLHSAVLKNTSDVLLLTGRVTSIEGTLKTMHKTSRKHAALVSSIVTGAGGLVIGIVKYLWQHRG